MILAASLRTSWPDQVWLNMANVIHSSPDLGPDLAAGTPHFVKLLSVLKLSGPTFRYGITITAVLAALVIRSALNPILGANAPYLPFAFAVLLVARFAGRGPALTETALSTFCVGSFFIALHHPVLTIGLAAAIGLTLFAALGVSLSLLFARTRESLLSTAFAESSLQKQTELLYPSRKSSATTQDVIAHGMAHR